MIIAPWCSWLVVVALVRVMHVALFVAVVLMVIALVHVVAMPMVLVVVALVALMHVHVAHVAVLVLVAVAFVHVVWHLNLLNSLQRQSAYVYLTAILPLVEASGRQILHPMRQ